MGTLKLELLECVTQAGAWERGEAFSNLDELINSGSLDAMDDQNSIFIGRAQTVIKE